MSRSLLGSQGERGFRLCVQHGAWQHVGKDPAQMMKRGRKKVSGRNELRPRMENTVRLQEVFLIPCFPKKEHNEIVGN